MEPSSRRGRRSLLVVCGLALFVVLGTTWFSSSRSELHDIGLSDELLVVSDAGPVRVRPLESLEAQEGDVATGGAVVRTSQSWLVRGPVIEMATEGRSSAFRVTCPSRFPCRASIEVFVPDEMAVSVVAAGDAVQIDGFAGALSVFAGDGGVSLGSVSGSVSIVTSGPVEGDSLGPAELTIDVVDSDVTLRYLDAPSVLAIVSGAGDVAVTLPDSEDFAVDAEAPEVDVQIASDPDADRLISIRSEGTVSVTNGA